MNVAEAPSNTQYAPPLVVGIDGLADLLHRARKTVIQDRLRRPQSLPPAVLPPGSRQPLWIVADVITWLREHPDTSVPGARRHP